jgi:hypothetical protein
MAEDSELERTGLPFDQAREKGQAARWTGTSTRAALLTGVATLSFMGMSRSLRLVESRRVGLNLDKGLVFIALITLNPICSIST